MRGSVLMPRISDPSVNSCWASNRAHLLGVYLRPDRRGMFTAQMTLLITVATKEALYLSSDYRLSNDGCVVETANGTKQLAVHGKRWVAQIAFTGVAYDGRGYVTRDWLSDATQGLSPEATLLDLVLAIAEQGSAALSTIHAIDNRLTVIVGAMDNGVCRLFLLTNWEPLFAPASNDRTRLEVREIHLSEPLVLLHGNSRSVPRFIRRQLRELVLRGANHKEIATAIINANQHASKQQPELISQGCWVQTMLASGDTFGLNEQQVPGFPAMILSGTNINNLLPELTLGTTIFQSVGYSGPATPTPAEIGEPRSLRFFSPFATSTMRWKATGHDIFRVSVGPAQGVVAVRKNARMTASFGRVALRIYWSALEECSPFEARHQRLVCVPTIDGAQPRRWSYTYDVRYDGNALELTICPMSVALRNDFVSGKLELLGVGEELLMSAPPDDLRLVATCGDRRSTANLDVRFLLRGFPELLPRPPRDG